MSSVGATLEGMPLPTDSPSRSKARALRDELHAATAEAAKRWHAFEGERTRLVERGVDLTRKSSDAALDRLQELHDAYERTAKRAASLRDELIAAIDGKALAEDHGGRLPGIADAFVSRLGGVENLKALVSGASPVPPFFDARIRELPQRQLFVRSVIPVVEAEGDRVWYVRHTAYTNQAAPVSPGAEKPRSTITIERVEQPVTTIAHVTEPIDRALLADFDELSVFLDETLRIGILLAEENQILNGNGTAPNLRGILQTTGIQTHAKGVDSQADAVYKAITKVRLQHFQPDAVVLHPNDWQDVRLSKTSQGDYLAAPIIEGDPDRLFGVEVFTSPVIAEGTGLVGAFGVGATIYDREQAVVKFAETGGLGDAGAEIFSRNQVVVRAEERLAFGVEYPAAFCEVTGL